MKKSSLLGILYKLFSKEISIKTVKYWGKHHGFVNPEAIELFKSK
jgi:hypothetical protein